MNCRETRERLALLLYGELEFDQEERVESHLDACAECRVALERERALQRALDAVEIGPSPSLLENCREDLFERMESEPAPRPADRPGLWDRFVDALALKPGAGWMRPLGAMALVAIGFVGARVLGSQNGSQNFQGMNLADAGATPHVRYVEPAADGRVQIVLDETRQRIVIGRVDDQKIRSLLVTAAEDPTDADLRAKTVAILVSRAQSAEVRDALVMDLLRDQNVGVRMQVMDGLKPFASQPDVRTALIEVLLSDSNPGLRTQAINVLTGGANGVVNRNMDLETVKTLQELIGRGEPQGYIRERCRRVLETVNASVETY